MVKGFTLIELITSMAIASIGILFTAGSWSQFIAKQRVTGDSQYIISLLNLARSEAISTRQDVLICGISSEQTCSKDWRSVGALKAEKDKFNLIYQYQLKANYSAIKWSSFQNRNNLTFNPKGFSKHQNGSLYLCHKKFPQLNRAIIVSKSGKHRIEVNTEKVIAKCS